jgi:hypothetical protein
MKVISSHRQALLAISKLWVCVDEEIIADKDSHGIEGLPRIKAT